MAADQRGSMGSTGTIMRQETRVLTWDNGRSVAAN
jgi:hypothetical protein